jgi:uncharacterized protein YcfL
MKDLSVASLLACALALVGCSASPTTAQQPPLARETVLLVSLEDGSVIKQTIESSADLCFKSSTASSTTCFTQGAAIVSPETNVVIGFEMIEDHIDLIAKSD